MKDWKVYSGAHRDTGQSATLASYSLRPLTETILRAQSKRATE
jgi:hypothetical protein